MENNIKIAKLLSGELVVGELVYDNDKGLMLIDCYKIEFTPQGVALIPPMLGFTEEKFNVSEKDTYGFYEPKDKKLIDGYLSVKSGIQITNEIPKDNKLITLK